MKKLLLSIQWFQQGRRYRDRDILSMEIFRNFLSNSGKHQAKSQRFQEHHRVRDAQQANAEGSQIIFLAGIFAHRADLRMHAAIELKGEPMFEAGSQSAHS